MQRTIRFLAVLFLLLSFGFVHSAFALTEERINEIDQLLTNGNLQEDTLSAFSEEERVYVLERVSSISQYPFMCAGTLWKDSPLSVTIKPHLSEVQAGDILTIESVLKNRGPVLIPNLHVKARIYKYAYIEGEPKVTMFIDEVFVANFSKINPNEEKEISFDWHSLAGLESGNYYVSFFVAGGNGSFPILGLPFGEDLKYMGTGSPFTVVGVPGADFGVNRDMITINTLAYDLFSNTPLQISSTDPVTLNIPITNFSNEEKELQIVWEAQPWSSLDGTSDSVHAETIYLSPKETKVVSHQVIDNNFSIYFATASLTWDTGQEKIQMWFEREVVNTPRINNVGISNFPIDEDTEATIFFCAHNTGSAHSIKGFEVELEVTNQNDKTIFSERIPLEIFNTLTPFEMPLVLERYENNTSMTVTARIYEGALTVDEVRVSYQCVEQNQCAQRNYSWRYAGIFGALVLLTVLYSFYQRRKNTHV